MGQRLDRQGAADGTSRATGQVGGSDSAPGDAADPIPGGDPVQRSRQGRGVLPTPPRRPIRRPPGRHGIRLIDVIGRACLSFHDLPIELAVDLAASVVVDETTARSVGTAIAAILENVRRHADARMVVIHADANVADLEWEVTVCDDGCGFESDTTPRGFGLAVRVEHALSIQRISTMIAAAPGEGTTVILRGPITREH